MPRKKAEFTKNERVFLNNGRKSKNSEIIFHKNTFNKSPQAFVWTFDHLSLSVIIDVVNILLPKESVQMCRVPILHLWNGDSLPPPPGWTTSQRQKNAARLRTHWHVFLLLSPLLPFLRLRLSPPPWHQLI